MHALDEGVKVFDCSMLPGRSFDYEVGSLSRSDRTIESDHIPFAASPSQVGTSQGQTKPGQDRTGQRDEKVDGKNSHTDTKRENEKEQRRKKDNEVRIHRHSCGR